MSKKNDSQPAPIPTDETPIWDLVIADMHARDAEGRRRYGTPLQSSNGRDMLKDAYEEVLDLAVYLRGELERRASHKEATQEWHARTHDLYKQAEAAVQGGDHEAVFAEVLEILLYEMKQALR